MILDSKCCFCVSFRDELRMNVNQQTHMASPYGQPPPGYQGYPQPGYGGQHVPTGYPASTQPTTVPPGVPARSPTSR